VEAWDGAVAWRARRGGDGDLGMGPRPGALIGAAAEALGWGHGLARSSGRRRRPWDGATA